MSDTVFNVLDFGATGDGVTDDTAAIQAAIDACAAAGGGTVYIPAGTYMLTQQHWIDEKGSAEPSDGFLKIRDGAHDVKILGDGMQYGRDGQPATVLKAMGGGYDHGEVTGIIRTEYDGDCDNITLQDLMLDGNRDDSEGHIIGFFSGTIAGEGFNDNGDASDIDGIKAVDNFVASGVEIANTSSYAWDPHELGVNAQFRDCVGHNAGKDGMALDRQVNAVISNFIAFDNDRHGLNIVTGSWNVQVSGLRAFGNGSTGLTVQRGSEDIPWPGSVTIEGSEITGNSREGVVVKMSRLVTLSENVIEDNGKTGILITGANDNVVTNNYVANNGTAVSGYYAEIQIQNYDDTEGVSKWYYSATGNAIYGNTIVHDNGQAKAAIVETILTSIANAVVDANAFSDNSITGQFTQDSLIFVGPLTRTNVVEANTRGVATGSRLDDMLIGDETSNVLRGGGGSDLLVGLTGGDRLFGGEGADVFRFTDIDDSFADAGDTIEDFEVGKDKIDLRAMDIALISNDYDGAGSLHFRYNAGLNLTRFFDPHSDFGFSIKGRHLDLSAGSFLLANDCRQYIEGTENGDTILAGKGNDTIVGGGSGDVIYSGKGNDVIVYASFADSSVTGIDRIMYFAAGRDTIDLRGLGLTGLSFDGPKARKLYIHYDTDIGVTVVESTANKFRIEFNGHLESKLSGRDFIFKEPPLTVVGTSGDDEIVGVSDRNVLDGLGGRDKIYGHDGLDLFRFSALRHSIEGNQDRIYDFESEIDKIDLRSLNYSDIVATSSSVNGELRLVYSKPADRTYFRDDHSNFEFSLEGDYRNIDLDAAFLL